MKNYRRLNEVIGFVYTTKADFSAHANFTFLDNRCFYVETGGRFFVSMFGNSPKRYQVIYADPPWSYDDKCLHRGGAERHYSTMAITDIQAMPVASLADDDCVLFMWATFPKLVEAFDVIRSWGFTYKTCAFVWVKTNRRTDPNQFSFLPSDSFDSFMGMGRWTRSNAEICLLATKGKPKRQSGGVHQVIYEPIDRHSKKPQEVRNRIVQLCGDVPRIELFARNRSEGWSVWGNEVAVA